MRRSEQEIEDSREIKEILKRAMLCRIGLAVDNMPYVVPLHFAYEEGSLYFHSAREGKKVDMLRKNPHVFFEATTEYATMPSTTACGWGTSYRCAMGKGSARFIDAPHEKKRALDLIMAKYSGRGEWEYSESILNRTLIVRIDIHELTGKQAGQ